MRWAVMAAAVAMLSGEAVADARRDLCREAAEDRGWRVRDIGEPKGFGEGRTDMRMRVRDEGRTFDAICMIEGRRARVQRQD